MKGKPGRARARATTMETRNENAMVTAETAMVLPGLLLAGLLLINIISIGITQVELVDASREAARMIARGDDTSAAFANAKKLAPANTQFTKTNAAGFVTVVANKEVAIMGGWYSIDLEARAVTTVEQP